MDAICGLLADQISHVALLGDHDWTRLEIEFGPMAGGMMRFGKYPCRLTPSSKAGEMYGSDEVWERHRHRYEVNPEYVPLFEEKGLLVSGKSPDRIFVEVIELPNHPWFLACQFHPEYKSRPLDPHPLFRDFIAASYRNRLAAKGGTRAESEDAYASNRDR